MLIDSINAINPFLFLLASIYWFMQARKVEREITTVRYEHMMHIADIHHRYNERHREFVAHINSKISEGVLNDN